MFAITADMVKDAYTLVSAAQKVVAPARAATALRQIMHTLEEKGTPRSNVWTVHVP